MKKIIGIAFLITGFAGGTAGALDRPTADIKVESLATTGIKQFVCQAQIQNTHDDSAASVRAVLLLPIGVRVLTVQVSPSTPPSVCQQGIQFLDGTRGMVQCFFGQMAVGESRNVKVTTTLPPTLP